MTTYLQPLVKHICNNYVTPAIHFQHLCNSCKVLATFMQPFKIIQSAFKENNLFITKQNIDIFDAPNIHIDLVPSYLLLSHMRGFWVLGTPGRMFQKFLTVKKLS